MTAKEKILLFLAEYPGSLLIRLLGRTLSCRIHGRIYQKERRAGSSQRVVYAFWHCHILPLMNAFQDQGIRVMISNHRDGETIARVARRFGFYAERGSTTRGGVKALKALIRILKDPRGSDIAITPDGPRGPARKAQSGAVFLAAKSGLPLVPVGAALDKAWTLKTWDRFQVPKPFCRCAIVIGEELRIDYPISSESEREMTLLLEERLQAAESAAKEILECSSE